MMMLRNVFASGHASCHVAALEWAEATLLVRAGPSLTVLSLCFRRHGNGESASHTLVLYGN